MIPETHLRDITDRLSAITPKGRRLMIAVAGPPGSGKSTLAEALVDSPANAEVKVSGARTIEAPFDMDPVPKRGREARGGGMR